MFDVGFWEIMFCVLIALVVVGPERLPRLAYTAGKWLGKGRAMLSSVKREIDRELKAEELKEVMERQQKSLNPVHEILEETRDAVSDLHKDVNDSFRDAGTKGKSGSGQRAETTPDP